MIRVWTDGCCRRNPGGAGGWACIFERNGEVVRTLSGGVEATTNNQMEMMAVLEGIKGAPQRQLEIVSDSTYVVKGVTLWMPGWKKRNWKTPRRRLIKNHDLWVLLDQAIDLHPAPVRFRWVKGHAGGRFNEMADKLAKEASEPYV